MKREIEKGESPDQVIESQQTSKGLSGLCEREQRSNHGARALPGTLCHAGSDIPPGMQCGFLPRPERHGAHRAGREMSSGVRLQPVVGRWRHLVTGHISSLRRSQGGFFRRTRDQPRAVGDEQHVHDHLL